MQDQKQALKMLKKQVKNFPETLVMLGSGWGNVIEKVEVESEILYKNLFGIETSVPGHDGKLIVGEIGEKRVAFMSGRLHMYEGYSGREATLPIRVFAKAGMKKLVVTSASGGINPKYKVGDIVILSDLLTLFLPNNPLVGPKFQDMSEVFDREIRKKAREICIDEEIEFKEGVYMYLPGPHFETPADKMAVRFLGADCVGMSTVPESIQARNLGVKVLGLSFVTNLAFVKHRHEDVVAAAKKGSERMVKLLRGILSE